MLFNKTFEQHTQALADYLPNGKLFEAKNIDDSNFRQLLRGLAYGLFNAQGYLVTLNNDYFPNATSLFLDEWEKAVGIPDECFDGAGDIVERRLHIVAKLASLGVQTAADFERLAAVFGITVTVTPLSDEAFPPFSVPFTPVALPESRFTIVVTGTDLVTRFPPYDVPFSLIVGESVLECLFRRQKPANCNVLFRNSV